MAGPLSRFARVRPVWLFLMAMALVALGWLGWQLGQQWAKPQINARPALWRITQGDHVAYLFGTVHAVPRDAAWLSPQIERALEDSDRLILEVADLEAERRTRATFERLGRSPDLPPIEARLTAPDAARYRALADRRGAAFHGLPAYESWAAALLINAAASQDLSLSSDKAGETVFAEHFKKAARPIRGLETVQGQLSLFDRLPESDQRLLLTQSIREADDAARLYDALYRSWAAGDLVSLQRQFLAPLARTPGLQRILIDDRNRHWAQAIDTGLRAEHGSAFIAVGAGHLIGPASLQARLAERGWHIARIQ